MMPEHCKEVSSKTVDFSLTAESIVREMTGRRIYRLTRYMVLGNGDGLAVVKVTVGDGHKRSLFHPVDSVEVISLPVDTVFLEMPEQDVLEEEGVGKRVLEAFPDALDSGREGFTVVVKGKFEHISFMVMDEPG